MIPIVRSTLLIVIIGIIENFALFPLTPPITPSNGGKVCQSWSSFQATHWVFSYLSVFSFLNSIKLSSSPAISVTATTSSYWFS